MRHTFLLASARFVSSGSSDATSPNDGPRDGDFAITVGSGLNPTFSWSGGPASGLFVRRVADPAGVWGFSTFGESSTASPLQHGTLPTGGIPLTCANLEATLTAGVRYRVFIDLKDSRSASGGRPISTSWVKVSRRPVESAQYSSRRYRERLAEAGLLGSVSRAGNPYDNAHVESFMTTLKHEEIDPRGYRTTARGCTLDGSASPYGSSKRGRSEHRTLRENQWDRRFDAVGRRFGEPAGSRSRFASSPRRGRSCAQL